MPKSKDIENEELTEVEKSSYDKTIQSISEVLSFDTNISNYDEGIIIKSIVSEFYKRNTNPEVVRYILKGIYNNICSEKSYKWDYFNTSIDAIYCGDEKTNNGFVDIEKNVLAKYYEEYEIIEIINPLLEILRDYEEKKEYKLELNHEDWVILNQRDLSVMIQRIPMSENANITWTNVINAYPQSIIIHDNPISGVDRNFTISWKNKYTKKPYLLEKKTISEMGSDLKESGWVLNKQRLDDTLSAIISMSEQYELASIRDYIEEDGFYYNDKEGSIISNYELHEPTKEEVHEALDIINDLSDYFDKSKYKLATCIKWGLVAPFSFARKQIGADFLPYLFLYGKSGSGKSTMGKIILYLWSYPNIENNLEGSSFNTEFRIGEQMMKDSFPLVIDESAGVFQRKGNVEMLKSSVQSPISRSKQQGGKFIKKPAYAPVCFTSNSKLPQDDGLLRRFIAIAFTYDERKDKLSQRKFNKKFRVDSPRESILIKLHGLSNFVGYFMKENPELLKRDWDELGNLLIIKAYDFIGESPARWLLRYEELDNEEDNEIREIEEIRNYLLNTINDKYSKKLQVKVYEQETEFMYSEKKLEEYYSSELSGAKDFEKRVFSVINQHLIPFMSLNKKRDGKVYVNFNNLILKELFDELEISSASNLKSLSQLLGWEHGHVSVNGKKSNQMYVKFNDFMDFLYPKHDDELVDDYEF